MIDFRNVYIKEQTSYRGNGRRIKVGIAKKMESRHRQVSAGLPGEWGDVDHRRMFFAHKTEQYLHGKLRRYATPLENLKPGSGGSEVFTVPSHILAVLRLTLGAISAADYFITFTFAAILSKIIYVLWLLLM